MLWRLSQTLCLSLSLSHTHTHTHTHIYTMSIWLCYALLFYTLDAQLFFSFSSYLTENSQCSPACTSQRTRQIGNRSNLGKTYIKGSRKKLIGRKCQENETRRWRKKTVILTNGTEEDSTRDADYGQITQLSGTLFPRSTLVNKFSRWNMSDITRHVSILDSAVMLVTRYDRSTKCILL